MKNKTMAAVGGLTLVVIAALVVSGCGDGRKPTSSEGAQDSAAGWTNLPADLKVVGVEAVAKDPKAHAGRVAIEGVVGKVFTTRGAFNLIDATEFAACG